MNDKIEQFARNAKKKFAEFATRIKRVAGESLAGRWWVAGAVVVVVVVVVVEAALP